MAGIVSVWLVIRDVTHAFFQKVEMDKNTRSNHDLSVDASTNDARQLPRVAPLIESSRIYGRGVLRGIAKYSHLHGPWSCFTAERNFFCRPAFAALPSAVIRVFPFRTAARQHLWIALPCVAQIFTPPPLVETPPLSTGIVTKLGADPS